MFVERRINSNGTVELWQCEWENRPGRPAKKVYLTKLGDEQSIPTASSRRLSEVTAICWSYGRTLGNIAVDSPAMMGSFPARSGSDAKLPCDMVNAGKFRNGADRWWCRTHQTHWGRKADIQAAQELGEICCANRAQLMNYVVSPLEISLRQHAEVGIWCSMPAAISTSEIKPRPPKIHVHVRDQESGPKSIDRDFTAISTLYTNNLDLFDNRGITRVNITPPAAYEFVCALELGRPMDCIECSNCGYPHLDLGDFALKPHRKHFCGNCGRDSTWSKLPIVSTPLKPLHDRFAKNLQYETPTASLDLDAYPECTYTIWASTPAIVWTAARPQEFGIHVHVHRGAERIVDDTFGEVFLEGRSLDRSELIKKMIDRCII